MPAPNPFACPFYHLVTDGLRRNGIHEVTMEPHLSFNGRIQHSSEATGDNNAVGVVYMASEIGSRKAQEDRLTYCPELGGCKSCVFLGVFDGTVGDFASDLIQRLVVPHLLTSKGWKELEVFLQSVECSLPVSPSIATELFPCMAQAMDEMCLAADYELLKACESAAQHYASSTGVMVICAGGCCAVGHLGDSRAALGYGDKDGNLHGTFLTNDHKPDLIHERNRIKRSGGSIEYLYNHNHKPFIRGGDFSVRKSRGEQPMQLQYSRAFGGKDLKPYGLSNEPDILCFRVEPWHKCLILASDGLWDILTAVGAVQIATEARLIGHDPAKTLVNEAISLQRQRGEISDNVTALVLFFHTDINQGAQRPLTTNNRRIGDE